MYCCLLGTAISEFRTLVKVVYCLGLAAASAAAFLPETLHQRLPDSWEDGEYFGTSRYALLPGSPEKTVQTEIEKNNLSPVEIAVESKV